MKKLLMFVMSFVLTFVVLGCSYVPNKEENNTTQLKDAEIKEDESKLSEDNKKDEKKLKVALMLPGDKNDAGWNQSAYEGLLKAEKEFGVEIAFTESIDQINFASVAREYATSGYDLVMMIGGEFADTCKVVGPEFPKTKFACFNGNIALEPNVASYRYTTTETGFMCGVIAACLTKSGKVGYVVGSGAAHIKDSMNSFAKGVAYINPDYVALTTNIDSMSDVALAKESAQAMIDQGADVLLGNANTASLGVIEAADEADIKALGVISDQYTVAPDTIQVSVVQDNSTMVMAIVKAVVEENFSPKVNLFGMSDGAIYVSDWHGHDAEVPEDAMTKINEIIKGIKDGTLKEKGILPKTSFE